MCSWRSNSRASRIPPAFTLVELLVVIGIIAILIAILAPCVNRARHNARGIKCAANVRTLCQGVYLYACAWRGQYPSNVSYPSPGQWWFSEDQAGGNVAAAMAGVGEVFTCPEDPDSGRSYSMNVWMSSTLEKWVREQTPPAGKLWGTGRGGSQTMLLVETWSSTVFDGINGWRSPPVVGYEGDSPGKRFGGGGGLVPFSAGRWGLVNSQIAFRRHRPWGSNATGTEPVGAVHIGYADGHVELKPSSALADPATGLSTLDSWWSPLDAEQNHQ